MQEGIKRHNLIKGRKFVAREDDVSNITFKADDEVIKKARKVAIDKNTTLTRMLREYLVSLARLEDEKKAVALSRLEKTFERHSRDMGRREWSREDLYERS